MPQSKQCAECGATFTRKPHRSHAQWANQTCCTTACANVIRARGRERQLGDLDRSQGKQAYVTEWGRRKAMPRWAAWWEDRRRAEDLAEFAATVFGGPTSWIKSGPEARQFIAGRCPGCVAGGTTRSIAPPAPNANGKATTASAPSDTTLSTNRSIRLRSL